MTITLKPLLKAGLHFGHPVQQWNPRMGPFIYKKQLKLFRATKKKKRRVIHLLDLVKTLAHTKYLSARLTKMAATGKTFLFVATQKKYSALISKTAKACNAYYINEKWLGGMLTNWETISLLTDRLRKYDIFIANGIVQRMPKQEAARAFREKNKLQTRLGGIKYMPDKPDLVIILGQLQEMNALKECNTLNIPSISIVDSNCDPRIANLVIPANDDSTLSLHWVFSTIVSAIGRGRLLLDEKNNKYKPKPMVYKKIYDKVKPYAPGTKAYKNQQRQKRKNQKQNLAQTKQLVGKDNQTQTTVLKTSPKNNTKQSHSLADIQPPKTPQLPKMIPPNPYPYRKKENLQKRNQEPTKRPKSKKTF